MLEKLPEAFGRLLREQRAGLDKIAFNRISLRGGQAAISVSSLAFADHAPIPLIYTADADGRSPPLQWTGVPARADSVVLIVEDADSPTPQPLVHAIAVDLPPGDQSLPDGALDRDAVDESGFRPGRNSLLGTGWLPPDPPPGHGVHRYAFQVFALAGAERWGRLPGRDALMSAIAHHAIASGCLIGTYERPDASVRDTQTAIAPPAAPE
jgi:Raf kinase inhibitor-like YbhB/YbcL family protein